MTHVEPLTSACIALSLPLAKSIDPGLTLKSWQTFCEQMMGRAERGMDCVRDDNGYILGLMAYRAEPEPRVGRILAVDPLIAADLYGRDSVFEALLEHMEYIALEFQCAATRLFLPEQGCKQHVSALEKFASRGFTLQTICASKPISAQAASLLASVGSDNRKTVPSGPVLSSDKSPP